MRPAACAVNRTLLSSFVALGLPVPPPKFTVAPAVRANGRM